MKKLIFTLAASVLALGASAQYYQDAANPDILHIEQPRTQQRAVFNVPQINGYNVYKADLHTHTIFSDGHTTIDYRIREAWMDGLDIYAVTEHAEYRPHESTFIKWLRGYVRPEVERAKNHRLVNATAEKGADKDGIQVDLNLPYVKAQEVAKQFGITVIPGIEITRTPATIGHYNALFIKDANSIFDNDPEQSIRNARAQGALIMHNHPGWSRTSLQMTEFEKNVYSKGLIDGIEIMNGVEFYPKAIERAKKYDLFMSSNTDVHRTTYEVYAMNGHHRNMTLILAKDKSLESLREALEAKRTLAYSFGTVAGDEKLLQDLFNASVKVVYSAVEKPGRIYLQFENRSSIDFLLRLGEGGELIRLDGGKSVSVRHKDSYGKSLIVENMWSEKGNTVTIDLTPHLEAAMAAK